VSGCPPWTPFDATAWWCGVVLFAVVLYVGLGRWQRARSADPSSIGQWFATKRQVHPGREVMSHGPENSPVTGGATTQQSQTSAGAGSSARPRFNGLRLAGRR